MDLETYRTPASAERIIGDINGHHPCPERVGIVGAGRLGTALARALTARGVEVEGP